MKGNDKPKKKTTIRQVRPETESKHRGLVRNPRIRIGTYDHVSGNGILNLHIVLNALRARVSYTFDSCLLR